jgi:hypothetical protein
MSEISARFLAPLMNIMLVLIGVLHLLKTSLLRRRASLSAPFAVLGMAAAMSAYMSVSSMIASTAGVFIFAGAIVAVVIGLTVALRK